VHLYEDYGESLVHAIEGMYAFAIWDRRARRLTVVRDRFGEKRCSMPSAPTGSCSPQK